MVLFGIRCRFTETVLERFLGHGLDVAAVVLPGPPGTAGVRRITPRAVLPLAGSAGSPLGGGRAPVYHAGPLGAAAAELVAQLAPDVLVVACYPRLIPASVRAGARLGALNIHPSLLPAGRGPDPLFWTLRRGDGVAGVTVHELTDQLDAGPILGQWSFHYPPGSSEARLERQAAEIGAGLALQAIHQLRAGAAIPNPQDEARATWEPWPTDEDYVITTDRPARAAFTFIRGVAARPTPVTLRTATGDVVVAEALAWADDEPPPAGDALVLRCNPGWLLVRPAGGVPCIADDNPA